ncbi:hypothetical protein [Agromyces sp. NPDC058064]|uniref:hypothetical protein n=1 Tax=Agromyces sp. NPDC058064 TaxID=3346322 RepID=UPI0036D82026
MTLSAGVHLDRLAVVEECGLGYATDFAVLVYVTSSSTKMQKLVLRADFPPRDQYELVVEFSLDGRELGGRLTIDTQVVVFNPVTVAPFAPASNGSIIWRESHSTYLEGVGSQFPTDSEDFAITRPASADAAWTLRVDTSDMQALFVSAVRLTLNSGSSAVANMLRGSKAPASMALARFLEVDITRQLVEVALNCDEVAAESVEDSDEETVSAVLRSLLSTIWPGVPYETLRRWRDHDPARIDSQIQHARGLGVG